MRFKREYLSIACLCTIALPVFAQGEPTGRSISLFYLSAYEGAKGMCPSMSSLPESTEPNRKMLQGQIGKDLGVHSGDGDVSETLEKEPEAAAALWTAGILTMAGKECGCMILDLILTKPPELSMKLLTQ